MTDDALEDEVPCGECHIRPGEICDICGRTAQAKACRHDAYKGMAVHGRCCPDCGTFMVDFGD